MGIVLYIGETKDFSDQWLIFMLQKKHEVLVDDIAKNPQIDRNASTLINRLYTTSIERFGRQAITKILDLIRERENDNIDIINSSRGFDLDMSRIKQFDFFREKAIPFVRTTTTESAAQNNNIRSFPYVLKHNSSGRNKMLKIINNEEELREISDQSRRNSVLQPLIKQSTCYRTEFIGSWNCTFTQYVNFSHSELTFGHTLDIIDTPLAQPFIKNLHNALSSIGVQVFSIEYFIEPDQPPTIIDFNLTSNYPRFLLEKIGDQIEDAWLKLII